MSSEGGDSDAVGALRLSNRAVAELELILAEDPMCAGACLRRLSCNWAYWEVPKSHRATRRRIRLLLLSKCQLQQLSRQEDRWQSRVLGFHAKVTKESAVPTKPAAQLLEGLLQKLDSWGHQRMNCCFCNRLRWTPPSVSETRVDFFGTSSDQVGFLNQKHVHSHHLAGTLMDFGFSAASL